MIQKMLRASWLVIVVCAIITVFFGLQLFHLRIENTTRTFMPKNDDSYQFMLDTEKEFGSMLALGVLFETKEKTILTPEYIKIISDATEKIEHVEYVENIDSLTNIDYIFGDDEGALRAAPLLTSDDEFSGTFSEMTIIKKKIIDWQEMYNRVIVNDNFTAAQMMITITASDENGEELSSAIQTKILKEIQGICEEAVKGSGLEVRYYGDPVMAHDAQEFLISDLIRLIPFVAIIVLLSLYLSFHTWSGTLLPLLTVLVSTIWSVGLSSLLGYSFTIVGSMIPVCLIACGSAYGIHVMTHYYIGLDKIEGEITRENHADAIAFGLKDVWVAVILAAITTIAGFISNISSPLIPLRSFSIFSAAGIAFSLLLSATLVPAMLYITPLSVVGKHHRRKDYLSVKIKHRLQRELARRRGKTAEEASGQTLYNLYHFFAGSKPRLAMLIFVIVLSAFFGIKHLVVNTALVNYFPPESKFRRDLAYIDENLSGTNSMALVISGNEIEGVAASEAAADTASDFGDFDFGTDASSESDFDFGNSDFDFGTDGFDFGEDGETSGSEKIIDYYRLTNPEILKAVDDMQEYLLAHNENIGKILSFTTFIKRMNQVMHVPVEGVDSAAALLSRNVSVRDMLTMLDMAYAAGGGQKATRNEIVRELEKQLNFNGLDFYEIPYYEEKYQVERRELLQDLVVQYLYLLSSDAITRFADDMTNPKAIRVQILLRSHSTVETAKLIDEINEYVAKYFPEGYTVTPTGTAALENRMSALVINSQLVSIVISLLSVFIIISLSFRSGWAGLIGTIPLSLVILMNFMVMGYIGINLDLCTSIVSSIAIGVGIDYTIHFMETYQIQRQRIYLSELEKDMKVLSETTDLSEEKRMSMAKKMSGGIVADLEEVARLTFNSSGKGIVANAIAVGLGFFVLTFSKFIILRYIGALVAVVMFTSSLFALTIIPGLLNTFDPRFMWSKDEREAYSSHIKKKEKPQE